MMMYSIKGCCCFPPLPLAIYGAQWETLCSKGRRKPLNVVLYQIFLHLLKDTLFAVKHAKFCRNMLTGSMSTCKNKNLHILRTLGFISSVDFNNYKDVCVDKWIACMPAMLGVHGSILGEFFIES